MKIKLLTGIAGRDFSHAPGAVVDMSAKVARRLIAAGYAEKVEPETATAEPAETAAKPRPRRRKRG